MASATAELARAQLPRSRQDLEFGKPEASVLKQGVEEARGGRGAPVGLRSHLSTWSLRALHPVWSM
eukprot:7138132-Alexandrium_andersonii.AAC.1